MLWEHGKCAVWDFTCPDTLTPSYRAVAVSTLGSVAAQAEMRKIAKYSSLNSTLYSRYASSNWIIGHIRCEDLQIHQKLNLGRRIVLQSGDSLAAPYLIQHLAIAVQRGSAALIIGTMGLLADWLSSFVCVLLHCLFLLVFVSTTWQQTDSWFKKCVYKKLAHSMHPVWWMLQ